MYDLDYLMVVQDVGESEEILYVESIIIQVFHWILDGNVALSQVSVHGRGIADNINYRIQVISRGLISFDGRYQGWSSNCF